MYVLMDIQWVQNEDQIRHPTQMAAIRVDKNWSLQNTFFTRIRPLDERFHLWNHKAYTGGSAEEFLSAPTIAEVSDQIKIWFQDDDTQCWWKTDPMGLFMSVFPALTQKQLVLFPYLQHFLADRPYLAGSAFHIADQLRIERYGSRHDSRADTEMMRRALQEIRFPQDLLIEELAPMSCKEKTLVPYVLDVTANKVHKKGCDMLPESGMRKEYLRLHSIVAHGCKPCSCCAQDFAAARRERNRRIVDSNPYNYIFSPNSNIFHTRDCKLVLSSSSDVRGAIKYKTCLEQKKKPCKICNPVPPQNSSQNNIVVKRKLSQSERRALRRLKEAQAEKKTAKKSQIISNQQLADLQILTHSGYAFWAATGYKRFHLRHCSMLDSTSNIKGFALYEDAIQMGYRPCRQCKPTPKHNLTISFPLYSKERQNETVEILANLCDEADYQHTVSFGCFQIETPKGIWRIYTNYSPYRIGHINKLYTPRNTTEFHMQPRAFLSLTDIFMYIKRHDS